MFTPMAVRQPARPQPRITIRELSDAIDKTSRNEAVLGGPPVPTAVRDGGNAIDDRRNLRVPVYRDIAIDQHPAVISMKTASSRFRRKADAQELIDCQVGGHDRSK